MNIDKIRLLLADYYDGSASGADIDALKRFFADATVIPDDMKVDAAIFRAMSKHVPATAPDHLRQRIIDATIGARPRRPFIYRRIVPAAAACTAIAIALGSLFMTNKTDMTGKTDDTPVTYSTTTAYTGTIYPDTVATRLATIAEPVADKHTATGQPHKTSSDCSSKAPAKKCYTEVTDSIQIIEITTRVLEKLNASFNSVDNGMKQARLAMAIIADPLHANEIKAQSAQ